MLLEIARTLCLVLIFVAIFVSDMYPNLAWTAVFTLPLIVTACGISQKIGINQGFIVGYKKGTDLFADDDE